MSAELSLSTLNLCDLGVHIWSRSSGCLQSAVVHEEAAMLASVLFAAAVLLVSIAISIDFGAPHLVGITVALQTR